MQAIRIFPVLLLALVAGCQSLGFLTPQTFKERLVYATSIHTAILDTIAASTDAGDLSGDEADALIATAENGKTFLTFAKDAERAGDVSTAEGKLTLGISLLQELQKYLRSRGITETANG